MCRPVCSRVIVVVIVTQPSGPATQQAATPAKGPTPSRPLSVGVTIDLEWTPHAGGHVKCWERFAEAAAALPDAVDLTVYLIGRTPQRRAIADTVRFVHLPPRLGTHSLPFVRTGTGETDLARHHPRLARHLAGHDVLHATHSFAFSRTAGRVAARHGLPLVSSIHTDLATFTPVYTRGSVEALLGRHRVTDWLIDRLDLTGRATAGVLRRETALLAASRRILITNPADRARTAPLVGDENIAMLRRGIDRARFHPRHRDRARLARDFGVPEDRLAIVFAGRVDQTKGAGLAADAVAALIAEGAPLHLLVLGSGAEAAAIAERLGPHASLPGPVAQATLAWAMASADVFLFPSFSEVLGNVVLEAKAAGLPVIVADHPGTAQNIAVPGTDGLLVGDRGAAGWTAALRTLADDAARRRAIGRAARLDIETRVPDWLDVVKADLLPVWRAAAAGGGA